MTIGEWGGDFTYSAQAVDENRNLKFCTTDDVSVDDPGVPPSPGEINCDDLNMPTFSNKDPENPVFGDIVTLYFSVEPDTLRPHELKLYYQKEGGTKTQLTLSNQGTYYKALTPELPEGAYSWEMVPNLEASGFRGDCPNGDFTVRSSAGSAIDRPNVIKTPLGDIPTTPAGFAAAFVTLAVGVSGGVAFLLMIYGSFRFMFAAGNPESVQQGREIITAAILGLIVVVFAVFILRLIGISILGLPM